MGNLDHAFLNLGAPPFQKLPTNTLFRFPHLILSPFQIRNKIEKTQIQPRVFHEEKKLNNALEFTML